MGWDELPSTIWELVLALVTDPDVLIRISRVCSAWRMEIKSRIRDIQIVPSYGNMLSSNHRAMGHRHVYLFAKQEARKVLRLTHPHVTLEQCKAIILLAHGNSYNLTLSYAQLTPKLMEWFIHNPRICRGVFTDMKRLDLSTAIINDYQHAKLVSLTAAENVEMIGISTIPSPDLDPNFVVRTVLTVLQNNDGDDNGIKKCFEFASPANKNMTGPVERFTSMIKMWYSILLGFDWFDGQLRHFTETQRVYTVTVAKGGETQDFIWMLGLQRDLLGTESIYSGCWMTDGVQAMERRY